MRFPFYSLSLQTTRRYHRSGAAVEVVAFCLKFYPGKTSSNPGNTSKQQPDPFLRISTLIGKWRDNFQNTFLESEDCLEIRQWEIMFFAARWNFLVKLLHKFDWWGLNLRVGKTYPDTGYIARLPNHKTTNPWASVLQKMKDIVSALTALLINATNHIYHNQKIVQCQSLLLSIHIKVFQIYWGSIWICW